MYQEEEGQGDDREGGGGGGVAAGLRCREFDFPDFQSLFFSPLNTIKSSPLSVAPDES
jgi:hypothetical protein